MKCINCDRPALAKGLCSLHYKRAMSTLPVHPTRDMSPDQRFDYYTNKSDDCWLWTGANFGRYGAFYFEKKTIGAHTYAYSRIHGEIPKGIFVCHRCDNPLCVNPDHLFLGTPKDNTKDMMSKGRGKWPRGDRHHLAKLSEKDISEIRDLQRAMSQSQIARHYGVSQSQISNICTGSKHGRVSFHNASLT